MSHRFSSFLTSLAGFGLLTASSAFAATPPTANLVLWLNPDSLVTQGYTNNQAVTYWPDSSGNNHNAVDRTGWATPVYTPSAINGIGAVKFGASSLDSLWIADNATGTSNGSNVTPIALANGKTMVVVFKMDTTDPNTNSAPFANYNMALGDAVDAMHFGLTGTSTQVAQYDSYDNVVTHSYVNMSGTTPLNNTNVYPGHILLLTHAQASGNSNDFANLYADGKLEAGATNIPYNAASQVARIGQNAGGGGYGFNGWISEVLVYDTALSDADRAQLSTYLADRYAVPEPASLALLAGGAAMVLMRRRTA